MILIIMMLIIFGNGGLSINNNDPDSIDPYKWIKSRFGMSEEEFKDDMMRIRRERCDAIRAMIPMTCKNEKKIYHFRG